MRITVTLTEGDMKEAIEKLLISRGMTLVTEPRFEMQEGDRPGERRAFTASAEAEFSRGQR